MFTQLALQFNRNPSLDDDEGFEEVPTAICPFDASHIMQPKNLITHINRCKSPNKYLYVECRYDPCHWVYMEQLQFHYQQCPTRKQYYADLDLINGDWDEEQFILKLQQKALRQKIYKKKRKISKLIMIVKLRKKLKKASSKQQFEAIKALLIKEQSCFTLKSNQNNCNLFDIIQVKSTAKYQPKLLQNQSPLHENTQNIPHIRLQMGRSFDSRQTINDDKFIYENHIQYPPTFYQTFHQSAMYQPQYFSFTQQQPFYPQYQLTSNFMKPNMMQYQQFYSNSDVNHHEGIRKKPLPEKGLMFSQTANTQDFIKKTYNNKNAIQNKNSNSNYQNNQQNTIRNNQIKLPRCYQNMSNFYDHNYIYQNNLYPQYPSYTPFIQNFVNYPTKFPQRESKYENLNNNNKTKNQKKIPHINDQYFEEDEREHYKNKPNKSKNQSDKKKQKKQNKYNKQASKKQSQKSKQNSLKKTRKKTEREYGSGALENELHLTLSKKILNFEITEYDFIPFDLHQDLTIRQQSSYQADDAEEKSSFLEMKEMLQILQENSKK